MSATQTVTTTTRKWEDKNNTKKTGKSVAKAYSASLKKAKSSNKEPKQRRCPTCGRPL